MFRAAVHSLAVLTSALCVLAGSAPAQSPPGGERWLRIGELHGGKRVTVELMNGDRLKGSVERVTEAGFVLHAPGDKAVQVDRGSVKRVIRKSRARAALIGLLVGFGAGFVTGAIAGPYLADFGNPGAFRRMKYGAGFGLYFGGAGAGVGALIGAGVTVCP